jgi:hypothetical protein
LRFEPNVGQFDPQVRYVSHGAGYSLFLTDDQAVMVLSRTSQPTQTAPLHRSERPGKVEQTVVRMKLVGGRPAKWEAKEKQSGISNYFLGNDPNKWRTNVPNYGRVEAQGIYRGVDLVCYGNQSQFEYDLAVAPGADPSQVQLAWEGAESLRLNAEGDLVLATVLGDVLQKAPRVYQEIEGKRVEVASKYVLAADNRVRFELASYDRSRQLLIDPLVLVYSTFLGGSDEDSGESIAVDAAGSAYITGYTHSPDFPTQSAYQSTLAGTDGAFVTKLAPAGNALVYSTFLGGNGSDQGYGIAVDGSGSAYVIGTTNSTNFPTVSAYQTTLLGNSNAFVSKLAPAGNTLVYSTYLGGSGSDQGNGIAVDGLGSAYVTGTTNSTDFPHSGYQTTLRGASNAFVTKLAPAGNALVYSTYLGGGGSDQGNSIAVDGMGAAYVTGATSSINFPTQSAYQGALQGQYNVFVAKLASGGSALVYSTYLGGSGSDGGLGIAVDGANSAYVTGYTNSSDFPTQSAYQTSLTGLYNAFVAKLTPAGNTLAYSTYLGGSGEDFANGIAVDTEGSAYVTGNTYSSDFPTVSAYQSTFNGGGWDAFVTRLAASGDALVYSTYLGGIGADGGFGIALDAVGSAYVTGYTYSADFPTQSPFQTTLQGVFNAFVTKLAPPLLFVPMTPCRVADTRNATGPFGGPSMTGGSTRTFTVPGSTACSIPATAAAWSLNVTAVPHGVLGYVTIWPAGESQPVVSTLNSYLGEVKANAAIVPAGENGAVNVFASDATDIVLDIDGYFVPGTENASALAFYPLTPCRVADTRNAQNELGLGGPSLGANSTRAFDVQSAPACNVPVSAQAYSLNFTVVPKTAPFSYLTTWPAGESQPLVSTLNAYTGTVTANAAIVPAGTGGQIEVYVTDAADLVLDINGYFAPPGAGGLSLYNLTSCRVLDTRNPPGTPPPPFQGTLNVNVEGSSCGVPASAQAYVLNATVVPPALLSYLTLWPQGETQPLVSTLNAYEGTVTSNMAIVPTTNGSISAFVTDPTQLILDISGYFAP